MKRGDVVKARLVDVAKEAGVSPKTVSNYVNGYEFMSESTREKVRAAVEKLQYVPNHVARNLRKGRVGIVGLAVPDLNGPYFAELAGLVTAAAERRGMTVLIDQTDGDPERERRIAAGLGAQTIDALIMSPLALSGAEIAEIATMPLVLLGERARPEGASYAGIDNVAAARAATEHLLDLGRTRIAAVGRVESQPTGTWSFRMRGFREVMQERGLPVPDAYCPSVRVFSRVEGERVVTELINSSEPPDAVFCFSDMLAVGALAALHRHDVSVPGDVAVLGFDDVREGLFTWPSLSTVAPDKRAIAEQAVSQVVGLLDRTAAPTAEIVGFSVVARASTTGLELPMNLQPHDA
ncbi:LacI family DNA-binding transcriptional regulator [Propionibacteriaceae bacterium Y1685]